jgi:hypothetical protein
MANTQSMCTSFLGELMTATHNFGVSPVRAATTADTFKAALYLASATLNASTTVYSATGEVSGAGYSAGGVTVTNATPPASTNSSATAGVGYWTPSASFVYTSVTLTTSFDTVLVYNSTQGNKAVSVHTFGSQTITAGTFTLTMPANTTTTALLRLATT